MHRSEAPQVSYPNLALSFQSCSWITLGINAIMMIIPLHLQSLRGAEGTVTGYTYCWITVVSAQVREEDDRAQCWNMGIAHEKSLCPVALCPSLCSSASSRIAPSVRPQHGSRFVMELIAIPCQEKDENQGGIRYRGGLYRALADLFVVFFGMGFLKEENYTRSPKGANGRGPHTWGRHFLGGFWGLSTCLAHICFVEVSRWERASQKSVVPMRKGLVKLALSTHNVIIRQQSRNYPHPGGEEKQIWRRESKTT